MAMKQTMQVNISFLANNQHPTVAFRKEATTLQITRLQEDGCAEPKLSDLLYRLEVDGKLMLELDGDEFARMLNACGTGTW